MARLCWTVLAVILASTVLALAGGSAISEEIDLTGTWHGTNDGSTYVITQRGNTVVWNAHSSDNTSWCHRFSGKLTGPVVEGDFVDSTRCGIHQTGHIRLLVVDEDHMKLQYSSVGFGTTGWERASTGWPKLPDAEVALQAVSNGCGGESWVPYLLQLENWVGNSATYVEPTTDKKYRVNFKPACDLHDAGYSGAKVIDVLNHGKSIDYFGMSREQVDLKFRNDLRAICARTIKDPDAFGAANNCMSHGGFANAGGAQTMYEIVRDHGEGSYWKRPDLDGLWVDAGGHMPAWRISMQGRNVTAHYGTPTGWRGEYRGRLISYDDNGVVKGTVRMVKGDQVVKGIATLRIDFVHLGQSDTHFQLEYFMSDGRVSGTMRRA